MVTQEGSKEQDPEQSFGSALAERKDYPTATCKKCLRVTTKISLLWTNESQENYLRSSKVRDGI